ncbi:MAG: nickel pincer cofactor biosynthesis protein LarB [candidate division WS1 bacterium]|nr:nickel pincer cofactor biosynthesis protein LarB [candidate division WS1 bacterium]
MDQASLRTLLEAVASGQLSATEALRRLRDLPFEDLGHTKVDHHRALRTGFPEVVFSPGKTSEQICEILASLHAQAPVVIATRADRELYEAVCRQVPEAEYRDPARIIWVGQPVPAPGQVAVVSAGTSDLPVAEEAAVTAEATGITVHRVYDVGVAGLHRLLNYLEVLRDSAAIVVVAGMEGALASVVGGLVDTPVIGVPTSIGYGASFHGLAALLGMLNSCATGVAVVNIDNGFGAGYFAALLAARQTRS